MEALIEFGKLLLPAGAVLYAMYLTVRLFIQREYSKSLVDIKKQNTEIVLPLRLQAYERICLFLERINPKNIIPRVNNGQMGVQDLRQALLYEMREEFNHNLSQQVYMSDDAWMRVRNGMEELALIINEAAGNLDADAPGIELARKVFEKVMEKDHLQVDDALTYIKSEIQQVF